MTGYSTTDLGWTSGIYSDRGLKDEDEGWG